MPSKNVKWLGNKLELCGNRIYKRVYIKGKNRTKRELVSWIIKRCESCGKFLKKCNPGKRCLKCCNKENHKKFLEKHPTYNRDYYERTKQRRKI